MIELQTHAGADLDLLVERVDVIHAGEHTFPLAEGIRAVAFSRLREDIEPLQSDPRRMSSDEGGRVVEPPARQ